MATPNGRADPSAAAGDGGTYIPAELIPYIAKHLTSLNEFFGLRTCCRAYRAALPLRRDLLAAQPPCLLVPHSASPSLNLFGLLEPGCPAFSLALFHVPHRRLHRFRARLPFARAGGVLTSDGAQVDAATGEVVVTHLVSGAQACLPKPPLPHNRVILTGGYVFAPAAGRTDVQYCSPWNNATQWTVASYGGDQEIQDWRVLNGALYGLLPTTCGLVMAPSLVPKDNNSHLELWLLGDEFDVQVIQAMQESNGAMLLGDCGGDLLLIFKVGSIDPAYKIFRWDANATNWAAATSLGGRTLFLGFDDFAACIGPDVLGIRGDCVYGSHWLPWAGGWSEYSLIDGTCKCVTAKYPGEPGVGFKRPQVWVLPSLFCTT